MAGFGEYARYDALGLAELVRTGLDVVRPLADKTFAYMPYTALFNATGQPAMSVPLHWNAAGLPIGMQFAARFGEESTLLRLAAQLERARPWFDRAPAAPQGATRTCPRESVSRRTRWPGANESCPAS